MPPLQSGFFGLRWSYVQNTHNNIHSLSYSTVNTWNALVLLRSDVPSRDIAFRRGFWLFPASPVINDDTTRDRDRDKDRAAVCSTGSWWPWLDDAEMVPGAIKRRKVDLDFYLHRIFRKTSFRFVNVPRSSHQKSRRKDTNVCSIDHCRGTWSQLQSRTMMCSCKHLRRSARACAFSCLLWSVMAVGPPFFWERSRFLGIVLDGSWWKPGQ